MANLLPCAAHALAAFDTSYTRKAADVFRDAGALGLATSCTASFVIAQDVRRKIPDREVLYDSSPQA